jgi:hypothetical protein
LLDALERNDRMASGIRLPTQKAFKGLRLGGDCRMNRAIAPVNGPDEFTMDVDTPTR